MNLGHGQNILVEDYDENYEPTEKEIRDYCTVLGLDPETEKDLLYIAEEGTKAPLPKDWKPVEDTRTGGIYYFNFKTNESTWDHPCDKYYRRLLAEERKKKRRKACGGGGGLRKGSKKPLSAESDMPEDKPLVSSQPGQLNPVGSGLGGGVGPLMGLPPLKLAPLKTATLAPVRPPPGMMPPTVSGPPVGPSLTTSTRSPLTTSHPATGTVTTTSRPSLKAHNKRGGGKMDSGGSEREGEKKASNKSGAVGGKGRPKGGDLLGTVELDTNLKISTQFEEEEEETSSGASGGFQSKLLGGNLLNPRDIGLKSEEEEDFRSSEEDNISEELMKILKSDEEEEEEEEGEEGYERPTAPLGRLDRMDFSPPGPTGALSPPIPSSLSPLPTTHGTKSSSAATVQITTGPITTCTADNRVLSTTPAGGIKNLHTASGLITTTQNKELLTSGIQTGSISNTTTANKRSLPITLSSSITPPPHLRAALTPQQAMTTNSQPLAQGGGFTVAEITAGGRGRVGVVSSENVKSEKMRLEHEKAVEELKKQLSAEMEKEKEAVRKEVREEAERVKREGKEEVERVKREGREEVERMKREGREEMERVKREGREEVERVRRKVEEERAEEERQLRDRKLQNMSELKKTLKEGEEEEEAKLVEEKENSLRRLRQKLTAEREKEEGSLKKEAAKSRQELVEKLETERQEEEARLRSVTSQELRELRTEAERKREGEKEEVRREQQRQLQVFREEQEDKLNKEKAEIEENRREQLEALRREEQLKVQLELERKQSVEEEREKEVQAHQQAITALEQELAAELKSKRSKLQEQHHTVLENIEKEFEASLTSLKSEHTNKVEEEKRKLAVEYGTISATLREEQESRVEQLRRELATSEEQYKQQSEKLTALQEECITKQSELEKQQKELEQRQVVIERRRGDVERAHERGRGRDDYDYRGSVAQGERGRERNNPLLSVVADASCAVGRAKDSLTHSPSHSRQTPGAERVKTSGDRGSERVNIGSRDISSEDNQSEVSDVGSMQLEELAPPPQEWATNNISDNVESVRAMLEQNQRTLLRILEVEQSQTAPSSRTKEAGKRSDSGARGRGVERDTRRGKRDGEKMDGGRRRRRGDAEQEKKVHVHSKKRPSSQPPKSMRGEDVLMTSTSKLQEGVRALSELEEKLRSSRQFLSSREHNLRDFHSQLTTDQSSDGEMGGGGGGGGGERFERSAAPLVAGKATLSDREGTRSPERVTRTNSTIRTPKRSFRTKSPPSRTRVEPPLVQQRYSTPSSALNGGGRRRGREGRSESELESGEASCTSDADQPTPTEDISEGQKEAQEDIANSLHSINRQLSQLMSKFGQGSPRTDHSIHPMDSTGGSRFTHHPLSYNTTLPSSSATRWAEPVAHVPGFYHQYPQPERRSMDDPTRAHPSRMQHQSLSRSGDSHVTGSPAAYVYPAVLDGSYREAEFLRRHRQTNWLQELQSRFPGNPLLPPPPPPPPPPTGARPPSAPLSPYPVVPHAQLVMDSDRNIHLVHM